MMTERNTIQEALQCLIPQLVELVCQYREMTCEARFEQFKERVEEEAHDLFLAHETSQEHLNTVSLADLSVAFANANCCRPSVSASVDSTRPITTTTLTAPITVSACCPMCSANGLQQQLQALGYEPHLTLRDVVDLLLDFGPMAQLVKKVNAVCEGQCLCAPPLLLPPGTVARFSSDESKKVSVKRYFRPRMTRLDAVEEIKENRTRVIVRPSSKGRGSFAISGGENLPNGRHWVIHLLLFNDLHGYRERGALSVESQRSTLDEILRCLWMRCDHCQPVEW